MTDPPRAALVVAVEGPSGVGKTTLANAMAARFGHEPLPEAFDRLGRPTLRFHSPEELARLELRLAHAERRRFQLARRWGRTPGRVVVADTGFLGPLTYTLALSEEDASLRPAARQVGRVFLEAAQARKWGLADLSVYLEAPRRTVRARARKAHWTHPADLWERHWRVGERERAWWTGSARRLLAGRVLVVDATADIPDLVDRVTRMVQRFESRAQVRASTVVRALLRNGLAAATVKR